MAEAAQSRVQNAIKDFINQIDKVDLKDNLYLLLIVPKRMVSALIKTFFKGHLRGLERNMHLCAANCCEDAFASVEDVHRSIYVYVSI